MNLFTPKPKEKQVAQSLTKTTLEQMFVQVDNDPLAGRGHLTKRELLIDRIIAHVSTTQALPAQPPRPIITEDGDVLDLKKVVGK